MIITIDGPVASGKSSVARALAQQLGFYYLNSGMLFRALAYILVQKQHVPMAQLAGLSAQDLARYVDIQQVHYDYVGGQESVRYGTSDITAHLKNADIDQASSLLSANPAVREMVVMLEHQIANSRQIVIDGRDTGSVVFPHAELKIYLTASLHVRAYWWQQFMASKGLIFSDEAARQEVANRDERDTKRSIAPLVIPTGAIVIDSSNKSIADVVNEITVLIQRYRQE